MRRVPTVLFTVAAIAAVGWSPSPTVAAVIFAVAAIVSMPHGALDIITGPAVAGRSFGPGYLALAAVTIAVWMIAPIFALAAFIVMAWWHFGQGDAAHVEGTSAARMGHGIASGGAVFAAALLIHVDQVASIFGHLSLGRSPLGSTELRTAGAAMAIVVVIAGSSAIVAHVAERRYWLVAELISLAVLAAVVHPVVSFAVYFVGVHSLRHLAEFHDGPVGAADRWRVAGASAFPVLAGVLVVVVAAPSTALIVQVSVIGLSALTTPHLLLTDARRRGQAVDRLGGAVTNVSSLRAARLASPERLAS